jgi:ABC-2 type transport system ATP-binding protein
MNVLEASGLGKRYGRTWALRECTLAVPAGHVAALIGPNGAGKTTLLNLAVGLVTPSSGAVTVLGSRPPGSLAALDEIAFVAEDTPVYALTVPARPAEKAGKVAASRSLTPGPSTSCSTGTRCGRPTGRLAGSGRSSGSRAAGCSGCQCCSSP